MALKKWSLPGVVANTVTDLVVPIAGKEVLVLSLIACNTSTTGDADVTVYLTDSSNTIKSTILRMLLNPGDSVHMDDKICLGAAASPDKIRVKSTFSAVSFLASGDES